MNGRYFLDTNIFVYTFDPVDRIKREKARELVNDALTGNQGIISWQVVQEFLNVAQRKLLVPFSPADCASYLNDVLAPLCEVFPSVELYRKSLEIYERERFSFYDCLIVAAAIEAGCKTLFTEDMQAGRHISGLVLRSPFQAVKGKG